MTALTARARIFRTSRRLRIREWLACTGRDASFLRLDFGNAAPESCVLDTEQGRRRARPPIAIAAAVPNNTPMEPAIARIPAPVAMQIPIHVQTTT
jgi:hypothetical protein